MRVGGIFVVGLLVGAVVGLARLVGSKTEKTPAKKPAPDPNARKIKELQEWFPIGSSFKFLGREMVACGHSSLAGGLYCIYSYPTLRVSYADETGVLHNASFNYDEAKAIAAKRKPKPKQKRAA